MPAGRGPGRYTGSMPETRVQALSGNVRSVKRRRGPGGAVHGCLDDLLRIPICHHRKPRRLSMMWRGNAGLAGRHSRTSMFIVLILIKKYLVVPARLGIGTTLVFFQR